MCNGCADKLRLIRDLDTRKISVTELIEVAAVYTRKQYNVLANCNRYALCNMISDSIKAGVEPACRVMHLGSEVLCNA